jgi:hypothetical protein
MVSLAMELSSTGLHCREVRLLKHRKVEMKDVKEPLVEVGDRVSHDQELCLLCDL